MEGQLPASKEASFLSLRNDKTLVCSKCNKKIFIAKYQIGGFWHLSGWQDKDGVKHFGGCCTPCFNILNR